LEAYYFKEHEKLYKSFDTDVKINNSFMKMYEDGNTVTSWDFGELEKVYSLSTAGKFSKFATTPAATVTPLSQDPITPSESAATLSSGANTFIERTIQCIEPSDGVSFEVTPTNFPVYIQQSKYNTDVNFDYGAFSILETKLNNAKLAIGTIPHFFGKAGVYVFGDHETPYTPQTLVFATEEKETLCEGRTQWPLTAENMRKFGIEKKVPLMREFDFWLHYIPTFFILVAFASMFLLYLVELRIERAEIERRLKREKASATLKKYFKKKQDKFDKVDYLGDMYKLMQQTVDEIKKQIADNQRRTDEEDRDNMNKMLKDKYSVLKDLAKSGADKDLTAIKQKVNSMLINMRFSDGRSLQEVLESMKMQKQVEEEEARLKAMQE